MKGREPLSCLSMILIAIGLAACGGDKTTDPVNDDGGDDPPPAVPDTLFADATNYTVGELVESVRILAADEDGVPDIVAGTPDVYRLYVAQGTGGADFGDFTGTWVMAGPMAIAAGDFDQDGATDLATVNANVDTLAILDGDGDGGFSQVFKVPTGSDPIDVCTADFDGDAYPDLAVANWVGNTVAVYLDSETDLVLHGHLAVEDNPTCLACRDLDGDGYDDVVTGHGAAACFTVHLGQGGGAFADAVVYAADGDLFDIDVADFDGDGLPDVVALERYMAHLYRGAGDGTFTDAGSTWAAAEASALICADLDGDGDIDIAATSRHDDHLSLLLARGDGTFDDPRHHGARCFATGDAPRDVAVADLDGDGDRDLVTANADGTVSVLKNRLHE